MKMKKTDQMLNVSDEAIISSLVAKVARQEQTIRLLCKKLLEK